MNEHEVIAAGDELYLLEIQLREVEERKKQLRKDIHDYMKSNRIEEMNGYAYKILRVDNPQYEMPTVDVVKKLLGPNAKNYIEPEKVKPEFRQAIPPELAEKLCPPIKGKNKQYITLRFKNEEKQAIVNGEKAVV